MIGNTREGDYLPGPPRFFDKEGIHLHRCELEVMHQNIGEGLGLLGGCPQPAADGLYLWPVISSAAQRLPRLITTSRVRATSSGGVWRRYMGVPYVGPKVRPQSRHSQRWRLSLRSFLITGVPPQWGQGGYQGMLPCYTNHSFL